MRARLRDLAVPAGVVVGLMLLVSFVAPERPSLAFFEVAAQVIPALLIVLALSGGLLERMNEMSIEPVRLAASIWVGLILLGEVSALVAIAYDEPSRFTFTASATALLFALSLVAGPYLGEPFGERSALKARRSREPRA